MFLRKSAGSTLWAAMGLFATSIIALDPAVALAEEPGPAFTRTEDRAPCTDYDPLRQPFFGDLHVHTSYSFDSYVSSQRNDPWDAYRYAKGEPITLADEDGNQRVVAQISRPLDFTGITDHAEYLGEVNICTMDKWRLGYYAPMCIMTRSNNFYVQLLASSWWVNLGVSGTEKDRSILCSLPWEDCEERASEFWSNIQDAAEDAYDRSAECSFTSFVAYEYTDAPNFKNLHRNVIYRNERVSPLPTSAYETGTNNVPELWRRLQKDCLDAGNGCDVLAIPHNPNLSGGLMFPDPASPEEARQRSAFEPLVELTQHKASSECRFDRLAGRGLDTVDEQCTFEQNKTDNLSSLGVVFGEMQAETGQPVPLDEFGRRNMVRNVLKDGLALKQQTGINPFKLGFIGSTDTHSATPGGVEEDNFVGHLGKRDVGYRNVQDHFEDNPGGLAVIWAEENSRDALFEGMRRKEAYATSGTRPILRFFGGWGFDKEMCSQPDLVKRAYAKGVPMGGDLPAGMSGQKPRFVVTALKDAGLLGKPGTDLQRIQIIKGWLDEAGKTHEVVIDIAGDAGNGAGVDPDTCEPTGRGFSDLCTVWEDESFDPKQHAFYYVRLLENPTCRWSTLQCMSGGVNPFDEDCQAQADLATAAAHERGAKADVFGKCCLAEADEPFYSPTLQERAWSSPIWYQAEDG